MGFLKKALKIVAFVAAVALAIPTGGTSLLAVGLGVSAVAATAIAGGLMVASSLLNKPKRPQIPQSTLSRLNVSIDPRTPRKFVFGRTAFAADLRDMEYTGTDNMYVNYFLVCASHQVNDMLQIYFDDKLAWDRSSGIQPDFLDYLQVQNRQVGTAANAFNISARMGSSRRYTGLAYTYLRFRRTGMNDKANSPFASSIPNRITIIGEGAFCYDPRQDSTVQGGSGPMRANDQSTWTWGEHARNPACQLLTYLLGWRINGLLAVGKGMPAARIDMQSFMAAANICDEPIVLAAGGTQRRYRSDGIFSEADPMESVLETFKATMNAEIDDSAGKLALIMLVNTLDDPVAHFGPSEIISGITWRPVAEISDRQNRIVGQYVDPRPLSLYQMVDYPEVQITSIDGIERTLSRSYAMVQDPAQAQRTAKEVLQRQQYGGLLEFTVDQTGWRVQKYDIVTVTHPPLGFYNKLFRIADISFGMHGQVPLVLREENEAIYAWDRDERAPVTPVAPSSYDYSTNPILQGIEEAGGMDVIWTKSATTPLAPAASSGVPAGWYATSNELPAGDLPIWVSYGVRNAAGLFEWQAPVQSATDIRYWSAVDAAGGIKPNKVSTGSVIPGNISGFSDVTVSSAATTSTTYVNLASLTFTSTSADSRFLVLVSVGGRSYFTPSGQPASYVPFNIQMLNGPSNLNKTLAANSDTTGLATGVTTYMGVMTGVTGSRTLQLQFRAIGANQQVTISDATIVVVELKR